MKNKRLGFTCAYAPVPIIEAAGFQAFRVLPQGECPDQAGQLLHDNLCPHVKRVLDRALANDLPGLAGMVFVNSCDAMRRVADAWRAARPHDKVMVLDLPSTNSSSSIEFLAAEYDRMARTLFKWNNLPFSRERVRARIKVWNALGRTLDFLGTKMEEAFYPGLAAAVQIAVNTAATDSVDAALAMANAIVSNGWTAKQGHAPVSVFGNLLFDPKVFDLFEAWNMHVTSLDFCTGLRFVSPVGPSPMADPFDALARSYMTGPPCARTMDTTRPGAIAQKIVEQAGAGNARGVMGFTLKFCDPYLARIPGIREALQGAGLPFLMLEGDCTMGDVGQQQTRIEAFTEMLGV
ncbi:MAG: 2-hydroxyacyl-CoA dehydratase [Desulfobacteraceae bacterium]|nr:2-hydroxyacyl-CoA dehydratase [Desulfobacteraceae bacterium]